MFEASLLVPFTNGGSLHPATATPCRSKPAIGNDDHHAGSFARHQRDAHRPNGLRRLSIEKIDHTLREGDTEATRPLQQSHQIALTMRFGLIKDGPQLRADGIIRHSELIRCFRQRGTRR
jgi:hypothetical protein